MLIGEVAARSGVAAKTLRYYQDIGIIDPPARTASGYRDFDVVVLKRLSFVRSAQAVGLTLGEIRGIVALREEGHVPCGHVLELLRSRAADIRRTIAELRRLERELQTLVQRAATLAAADCDPQRVCHLLGPP